MFDLILYTALSLSFVNPEKYSGRPVYKSGADNAHKQEGYPASKHANLTFPYQAYDYRLNRIQPGHYQVKYHYGSNELKFFQAQKVAARAKVIRIEKQEAPFKISTAGFKKLSESQILITLAYSYYKVYAILYAGNP